MFFSPAFQRRLVLKVVDEAHIIYSWGLVESRNAKHLSSHLKIQDRGAFRPSYGNLCRRFLATERVPLLMMSATCPPQAVQEILNSLKIKETDVDFHRGELVRPEIRLIRRSFPRPLAASISHVFPHKSLFPDTAIPPTLIYSGTQNDTLEHIRIINETRGSPLDVMSATSTFAQRYHASTAEEDKLHRIRSFTLGHLAVLCCTLALGLGQNWHRVRRVLVVGRQDPCHVTQMIGRGGRDGRRSLGILLVEATRTNGKNVITDFKMPTAMCDDDRMDALAITTVCLRVAIGADLRLVLLCVYPMTIVTQINLVNKCRFGYIPLSTTDPTYIGELERQDNLRFPPCDCSNCEPEAAEALWNVQDLMCNETFDTIMQMPVSELHALADSAPQPPKSADATSVVPLARWKASDATSLHPNLINLVEKILHAFAEVFHRTYSGPCDLVPTDLFAREHALEIVKNRHRLEVSSSLNLILGSETISGSNEVIWRVLQDWKDNNRGDMMLTPGLIGNISNRGHKKRVRSMEGLAIDRSFKVIQKEAKDIERATRKKQLEETRILRKQMLEIKAAQKAADVERCLIKKQIHAKYLLERKLYHANLSCT